MKLFLHSKFSNNRECKIKGNRVPFGHPWTIVYRYRLTHIFRFQVLYYVWRRRLPWVFCWLMTSQRTLAKSFWLAGWHQQQRDRNFTVANSRAETDSLIISHLNSVKHNNMRTNFNQHINITPLKPSRVRFYRNQLKSFTTIHIILMNTFHLTHYIS